MKRFASALLKGQAEQSANQMIQHALDAIRGHLGMEVAYVSEIGGDQSAMRAVSAPGFEDMIKPGDVHSLDDVYCRYILRGELPEAMPDTGKFPLAASMPITQAIPIGSHMSVPIRLPDGKVYGMFCCFSRSPNPSLNERDLQVMRMFADMAGHQINRELEAHHAADAGRERMAGIVSERKFSLVYQPITRFLDLKPVGFEALTRFSVTPRRPPNQWFDEAAELGMGLELETVVLETTLADAGRLPADCYLSINASPDMILSGKLLSLLSRVSDRQIVLEITEHQPVADYGSLCKALRPLREAGVLLAVDDAGAGYSTMQHILQREPDMIKLDMGLTRGIDAEPARRALATALIYFARETGSTIIAEGIETEAELETLKLLGIDKGQGFLLGRPMTIEALREEFRMDRKRLRA